MCIVMNPVDDRRADGFRNSDHSRTDEGEDIMDVDDVGTLLSEQSLEPSHARGRVYKTDSRISHLQWTAVDDGIAFFYHRNYVNARTAQQRNLIVYVPVFTGRNT